MQRSHCLNCNAAVYPQQNFCTHCGQKADIRRLTFRQLFLDFFDAVFSIEKGLFRLAKGLLMSPGATVAALVGGKRKYYVNPFTFVAICITVVLILNGWLKLNVDPTTYDPKWVAAQPVFTRSLYVIDTINFKTMDLSTLLMSPWFAFCLWIFFRKRNRNVAEITLAVMLFIAFATLLTRIFMAPLVAIAFHGDPYNWSQLIELLLQTLYISWGLGSFFNYKTFSGFFKTFGVMCLAGVVGLALEIAIICLLLAWNII